MLSWRLRATLSPDGVMALEMLDSRGGDVGRDLALDQPVELLIASVAGCFVKSCHMVQNALGAPITEAHAEIYAEKAADKPNRVRFMRLSWGLPGVDPAQAGRIAREAKRICTVANSLSCDFELVE